MKAIYLTLFSPTSMAASVTPSAVSQRYKTHVISALFSVDTTSSALQLFRHMYNMFNYYRNVGSCVVSNVDFEQMAVRRSPLDDLIFSIQCKTQMCNELGSL